MVPISVNISRSSLVDRELPHRYRQIVDETGVDPGLLYLEITESYVCDDVLDVLRSFRQEGFRLLMDDFGQGSSNLANLRKELFSGVKFDRSLVRLIGQEGEKLLAGSVHLVQSMGMWITVEGVEYPHEAAFLKELGCDEIQGYFYYRPMDTANFAQLLGEIHHSRKGDF